MSEPEGTTAICCRVLSLRSVSVRVRVFIRGQAGRPFELDTTEEVKTLLKEAYEKLAAKARKGWRKKPETLSPPRVILGL